MDRRDGYRALRRFARRWPGYDMGDRRCVRPGCTLTTRLRSDGMDVADVPANLAAPGAGAADRRGRKNDDADAVSMRVVARSARRLNSASVEGDA